MSHVSPFLAPIHGMRHLAVVDLEATCGPGVTPKENEIIEIGAVMVHLLDGGSELVDEFQTFVKPVRHPVLTPFCVHLTSITQDMVEQAPRFPQAYRTFLRWMDRYADVVFAAWGAYDARQLRRDCTYHGLADELPPTLNLKRAFAWAEGIPVKKAPGLGRALQQEGLQAEGVAHRAIDDARNAARLLPRILAGRRPPTELA